jgi:hemolysin activation/secretion protein
MRPPIRSLTCLALLLLAAGPGARAAAGATAAPGGRAGAESKPADNKFDIWEFRVLGNHVLPVRSVERAVYPLLGPARDLDTVKSAVSALEKAYKDAGYGTVFVDIPEQEVTEGVIRLKVTEGVVERVRVRGERYFSGRQIRAALPALVPGETPQLTELQKQLTALNSQTPDRLVTPVLKAGSMPGTTDVDLVVKDQLPLDASVQYDNRHTAYTTPNRLTATLAYDNLWQRLDSISLQYQTAPADPQNAVVESGTYLAHFDDAAGFAAFSYIHTSSNVLAVGTLGVLGSGDIYGAHWLQPLPGGGAFSQNINVGADYKDVRTEVLPDSSASSASSSSGAASAPVTAPVTYMNWSGAYTASWMEPTRSLTATLAMNFGIDQFVNKTLEFSNARYDASPSYFYLRFTSQATQNLPAGLSLFGRLSGQWATTPLVNNEQFSLGGEDTVRGYLEAETLGDLGVAGTFELHSPNIGALWGPLGQLYVFGFVDGGVASLLDALPGQHWSVRLWSTGGGLRLVSPTGLSGSFDYAVPEANGIQTHKGDGRMDFLVRYGF